MADPQTFSAEYAIATGQSSLNDNALEVKANNREYYSWGVQSQLGMQFNAFGRRHEAEVGVRYHEDQIDRFQWIDLFRMDDGIMELTQSGIPGTESNRIGDAQVWAAYSELNMHFDRLTVVPGIRYESIKLTRDDFGKEDPNRTGVNLNSRENKVDVFIPGIGLDYQFTTHLSSFIGVHKGFAPPGSREKTKPEESINYEAGIRMNRSNLSFQSVLFYNDYSNLLGADLVATGGEGTGDQFNGGNVNARGLELSLNYDFSGVLHLTQLSTPLRIAYTFTDSEFNNSFESEYEPWGTVTAGDELPYVPQHQLFTSLGIEGERYRTTLSAKYISRMRTVAGQDDFIDAFSTDAHLVFDFSADFNVTTGNTIFFTIRNLFDEKYVAAKRPAGARPGLPRTIFAGFKTTF